MSYYILSDDKPGFVWNHYRGGWCVDFDAEYNPNQFGYTKYAYAIKRAGELMTERNLRHVEVIDRVGLFIQKDLTDWAKHK